MSVETVWSPSRELYVIEGDPERGYFIYRIGKPVTRYTHKFEARHEINAGTFDTHNRLQQRGRNRMTWPVPDG